MTAHDSAPTTYSLSARTGSDLKKEPQSPETTPSAPKYWRSLSELRGNEKFDPYLDREFPVAASEFPEGVSRRRWMQLMGASLAMVGAAGCRYPEEEILPFVIRPEGRVPGETYERATNFELAGRVYNLLVSSFDGRPLKIEPNPEHPGGGGTDVFSQASILGLYDPDRARGEDASLLRRSSDGRANAAWEDFDKFAKGLVKIKRRQWRWIELRRADVAHSFAIDRANVVGAEKTAAENVAGHARLGHRRRDAFGHDQGVWETSQPGHRSGTS